MRRVARLAVVVSALLTAATARGQETGAGEIGGRVRDGQGAALPGVTITVAAGQGTRVLATDEGGRFLAAHLTPGHYTVRAELDGFRTVEHRDVEVRLGHRVELDIVLAAGRFAETLEVTGKAPVVDFASPASGVALESDLLDRVPVGRRFSDALYLAPGVNSSGGAGAANPSISGASGLENLYYVDGVNINDVRYGGLSVYSSDYGSLGSGVTYEFVDEIAVTTGGAPAEQAHSTGGVVNVITKSGSNRWRGEAFAYTQPAALEGDREQPQLATATVKAAEDSTTEAGFSLGGPLARDRAFVFLAANPQWQETTFVGLEEHPRNRTFLPYAAKLTWYASPSHRLDLSAFGDPTSSEMGPQATSGVANLSPTAFSELEFGAHNQSLRYQGTLSDDWLLEGLLAYYRATTEEKPAVDEWQVTDDTVRPSVTTGGRGGYTADVVGSNLQYSAKATWLWRGHEAKAGVAFEDMAYDSVGPNTGPPITLANGQRTASGVRLSILADPTYGKIYRVTRASLSDTRATTQEYRAAFVQDRIEIGRALALSLGVRYEQQQLVGSRESMRLGGNWAPRLGVVWDPTGAGRVKLSASAGAYFAKMPNSIAVTSFSGGVRVLRADYLDRALTQPIADGVLAGGVTQHLLLSGASATHPAPGIASTYIREATLGVELEPARHLGLGLRFHYRDMPRVIEDVGNAAVVLFYDGTLRSVDYVIANPREGYPATVNGVGAFEDPIHEYRAVELTLDRRFADRWALLASYRWSRLEGTYEGFYANDTDQSSAGLSALFDFPTDDPSYTEIGVPVYHFRGDIRYNGSLGAGSLPTDRTHQLKVYGSWAASGALNLGGGVTVRSGVPLTATTADPVYNRAGGILVAPRGSGLATVDGFKRRTPSERRLDLHADYGFTVAGSRLILIADVFNVTNRQAVASYDQNEQRRFRADGTLNPDYGKRSAYQAPRSVRLGLRFEF